ncbi:MAG: peptidase [Chlorobi bacterium]|nr:peptidase [Chlorobiota bacterium]
MRAQERITTGYDTSATFSPAQLRQDFELFRRSLEGAHPGLYRYTTKPRFDSLFGNAALRLDSAMTEREFLYGILKPLVVDIRDQHTVIRASDRYENERDRNGIFLPLEFRYTAGDLYLYKNYSRDSALPVGARILSINGTPARRIIETLLTSITADGTNLTAKYHELGEYFQGLYHNAIARPDSFRMEMLNRTTGRRSIVTIAALPLRTIGEIRAGRYGTADQIPAAALHPLEMRVDGSIAILTLRTFDDQIIEFAGTRFSLFIDSAFAAIRDLSVRDVVIDLRDNHGGSSFNGPLLYSYLTNKPFPWLERLEVTRATRLPDLRYDSSSFYPGFPESSVPDSAGRLVWKNFPLLDLQQPSAANFNGRVYVLIDGGTQSAAGHFAAMVKGRQRGEFIGEEAGAAYRGGVTGLYAFGKLPNTGIRLRIPLVKSTLAISGRFTGGVIPDHPIAPAIDDIIAGRDPVMAYALNLVLQRRKADPPAGDFHIEH